MLFIDMKKMSGTCLVVLFLILSGCENNTPVTSDAETAEEMIELSIEEVQLLETATDTASQHFEPVTSDNYEEKLKELEEILNSDSE